VANDGGSSCRSDTIARGFQGGAAARLGEEDDAITNPRIRVCSTVVLTVRSPALRNSFIPTSPRFHDGIAHVRSKSLTTNISVNLLSNRDFKSYDDLVDHCCEAWNKLTDQSRRIMSIGLRHWAHGF
jgi:hypothetical protein